MKKQATIGFPDLTKDMGFSHKHQNDRTEIERFDLQYLI